MTYNKFLKYAKRIVKRVAFLALTIYFIPYVLVFYFVVGLYDILRSHPSSLSVLDRYYFGNGFFTWLLSPFNTLLDIFSIPYWNKGIYKLEDLPDSYQEEIKSLIDTAQQKNIPDMLEDKILEGRSMIFFKWYGKNLETSLDIPEYHKQYKYVRTIGVSVFTGRQSTTRHFGPLRATLRVLYNINDLKSDDAFIEVRNQKHYWNKDKLFIFDDTLLHQSVNETDEKRYCMFVDIIRPSLVPAVMDVVVAMVRVIMLKVNGVFYQKWKFIK